MLRGLLLLSLLLADEPARRRAVEPQWPVVHAKRVVVVILENTDARVAETLPFLTRLAARGAILRNDHGIGHPSQPNYLAMVSGSTHGITGSVPITLDASHLGDLVERRGLTWKIYAEQYPGNCFLGETSGTVSGGQYVRRHVPFLSFANVQHDFNRCVDHVVDSRSFDADVVAGTLPNLSIYIPENQHNGHDSTASIADAWLEFRFGPLLDDPRLMNETLLIVTYDESASSDNRIITVLFGSMVREGAASFDPYDHYDLLRTIENVLGVGTLGRLDAAARPITGIWLAK
jgi:acid phosphatase